MTAPGIMPKSGCVAAVKTTPQRLKTHFEGIRKGQTSIHGSQSDSIPVRIITAARAIQANVPRRLYSERSVLNRLCAKQRTAERVIVSPPGAPAIGARSATTAAA